MAGRSGVDDQGEGSRTPDERLAALEAAVDAVMANVGPDGSIRAQRLFIGAPTGEASVTMGTVHGYATLELRLGGEPGADTKVVLFAGRGPGGVMTSDDRPRLGAALFGDGICHAGVEVTQDSEGRWSVASLGELP